MSCCLKISGFFIMIFKNALKFGLAGVIAIAAAQPVVAKARRHAPARVAVPVVTGMAASHDMRREGNRLCFSDHFHYGSSAGLPSRRAAEAGAARSWSDFVNFEYGGGWDNFARASSKEMKCAQSSSGWGCDASARPCR